LGSLSTTTTFWSFKGGVGRSLLAANVGAILAREGRRVLLWDLDVEAPGLHLIPSLTIVDPPARGLLDWLAGPPDLDAAAALVRPTVRDPNLMVLPAFGSGQNPALAALAVDWHGLLVTRGDETVAMLHRLITRLSEVYRLDHVLIDARTGFTDLGGVVTGLLPDRTVLVGGYGAQQIVGWSFAWKALTSPKLDRGGRRDLDVVLVVSPVPDAHQAGGDGRDDERRAAWRSSFPGIEPIEIPWDGRLLFREDLLGISEPESRVGLAYRAVARRVDAARTVAVEVPRLVLDALALLERLGFKAESVRDGAVLATFKRPFGAHERWMVVVSNRGVSSEDVPATDRKVMVVAPDAAPALRAAATCVTLGDLQREVFDPGPYLAALCAAYERSAAARAPAVTAIGPEGVVDPVEALLQRSDPRAAVVGRGAPAVLDRLAYAMARRAEADPAAPWPVRLDLRARRPIGELLRDRLGVDAELACALTDQGRVVLLVDGSDAVEPLVRAVPRARVVADLASPPPGWPAWTLTREGEASRGLTELVRERAESLPWLSAELGRTVRVSEQVQVAGAVEGGGARRSLREAVADEGVRLFLLGEPGAGKSTLLARLAVDLLDEGVWLPVILQARHALEHADALVAAQAVYGGFGETLQAARDGGRLVWLIDGVDEAPGGREKLRERLAAWEPSFGRCRVVMASRPHGKVRLAGYEDATVCPLGSPENRRLVVGLGVDEAVAEVALSAMEQGGARMAEVAGSPLLLTLAAMILRADGTLPRGRERLYERAVVLRMERERVNPEAPRVRVEARQVLEDLSLRLHGHKQDPWPDSVVSKVVRELTGHDEPLGWLHEVARETGLIVKVEGGWVMPHRTLREHLAACALQRRGLTDDDLAAAERDEGRWAEVLALLAARLGGGASELVARLRARGKAAEPLMWKVLADAEGLSADEVVAAVGLTGGREAWEERMKVLAALPELVGRRLDLVVEVAERLGHEIEHGAEIWQLREVVREVADGAAGTVGPGGSEELVRARARRLVDTILFLHRARGRSVRDEVAAAMVWCRVPAGRSWIGAHADDFASFDDEKPGKWVAVTADVELGRDPVTSAQYERFDPGHVAERGTSAAQADAADHPVVSVSWFEAAAFAAWLGARLPTEVEWEHACRAGTTSAYWSGNSEADLAKVGWYGKNSGGRTHAVGDVPTKLAHPFGLRHLHGNVWEWTDSWWTANHAALPDRHDPAAPPDRPPAGGRVVRGGTGWGGPRDCRSAYRSWGFPSNRDDYLGFRLLRLPAVTPAIDR
jgi:formylglycine-generating enzyme required for sulfatase activity/MinD-like ATPase involved in chromosome partitioning or flagellar assembly